MSTSTPGPTRKTKATRSRRGIRASWSHTRTTFVARNLCQKKYGGMVGRRTQWFCVAWMSLSNRKTKHAKKKGKKNSTMTHAIIKKRTEKKTTIKWGLNKKQLDLMIILTRINYGLWMRANTILYSLRFLSLFFFSLFLARQWSTPWLKRPCLRLFSLTETGSGQDSWSQSWARSNAYRETARPSDLHHKGRAWARLKATFRAT